MGRSLEEMLAALPAKRRRSVEKRGQELIAEEMTLRELRKALGATQEQLAQRLGKPQASISRMEAQTDMLVSTLDRLVRGMGGRVSVTAEFPGRKPVRLAMRDIHPPSPRTRDTPSRPAPVVPPKPIKTTASKRSTGRTQHV